MNVEIQCQSGYGTPLKWGYRQCPERPLIFHC